MFWRSCNDSKRRAMQRQVFVMWKYLFRQITVNPMCGEMFIFVCRDDNPKATKQTGRVCLTNEILVEMRLFVFGKRFYSCLHIVCSIFVSDNGHDCDDVNEERPMCTQTNMHNDKIPCHVAVWSLSVHPLQGINGQQSILGDCN